MNPEPLPPAHGVAGHLRYSLAAIRTLRAWRRTYVRLDQALRAAVRERDDALAELGEEALHEESTPGGQLAEFADTLGGLKREHAAADEAAAALRIDLAAAESTLTDDLAAADAEVARVRGEMVPVQQELERLRKKQVELERLDATQEQLRKNLEAGRRKAQSRLDDGVETTAERARLLEEIRDIDGRLETLSEQRGPRLAEIEAMGDPLDATRARKSALDEALSEAQAERDRREDDGNTALGEMRVELAALERRARRFEDRRHAVLMDVGREVLDNPPAAAASPARTRAQQALARIEALRDERSAIDEARARFDGGPLRRTTLAVFGLLLLLFVSWVALSE